MQITIIIGGEIIIQEQSQQFYILHSVAAETQHDRPLYTSSLIV